MTAPVRVAHVTTVDATLRLLLMPQLTRLRDEGFDVVAVSAPGRWVADLEAEGIRHVAWPHITRAWGPGADGRAFRALLALLRRERLDLVHTHNPKPGVMGRIAARMLGVPCVANTVHGLYASPDDPPGRRIPVLAMERLAARFSDLELYQSAEDLAWARRIGLVDERRSVLLGNGIDVTRFRPGAVHARRVAALRADLGIPREALVVGTVGRLVAEKGYRDLLAAAAVVRRAAPDVRFLAIGPNDPAKPDALDPGELERAREDVVFTGWREDVRDLLAVMDVFALPSRREGMPRSAIEAAGMGLPLVLTDIRGCREVARDGEEGLLVPARDPRRLGDAILALVRDGQLRRRLGTAARARAVERFDERRVADTVVREYRQLLERKGVAGQAVEIEGSGGVQVRAGRPADAAAMARFHAQHRSAFLPMLGPHFLRRFYLAQIGDPGSSVAVAELDGRVVGFCTGVVSMSRFMRRFALRHGVQAAAAAGPRLLRPEVARRLMETVRYPARLQDLPEAELVFAAVDPASRDQRLGGLLTRRVVDELGARGADEVRVFISVDNEPSNRMISRLGFERRGEVVVHEGSPSNVYVVRTRKAAEVEVAGLGPVRIRPARRGEEATMARLHAATHPRAFLPTLGPRFLELLYGAHIEDPFGVALVAERGDHLIGYVTGLVSTEDFRRHFLRRHALRAVLAAAPRFLRPDVLRRAWELRRYHRNVRGLPQAELTFIALDPDVRSRGLGTALCLELFKALEAGGARGVKTFVATGNEISNRLALRVGFRQLGGIAVHGGELSNLYVRP